MDKIMVMATFKLNDENLLEDWKMISAKINQDLVGQDGFISRDVVRGDDGLMYCILKWESKAHQEKFMADLTSRTDEESYAMMTEFERVVDVSSMKQEFLALV